MALEAALGYWIVLLLVIAGIELWFGDEAERDSARRRWPANAALVAISAGMAAAVPVSGIAAAHWSQEAGYGALSLVDLPYAVVFVASFLMLSLRDYAIHLACHKIPVLWRFHKIHHSDRALDITTTFRVHPVMYAAIAIFHAMTIVVLGLDAMAVTIYAFVVLVIDLAHHSRMRVPARIDRSLRSYIITPALHHIHHSDYHPETDSNYGHDLALWDRLFGTYLAEPKRPAAAFRYGLKQFPEERADDLHALLAAPFRGGPHS